MQKTKVMNLKHFCLKIIWSRGKSNNDNNNNGLKEIQQSSFGYLLETSGCQMTSLQHSLSLCRLSVRHWISIRMESMLISADCSLHRVLKQHWKVISSLRTWPGLLLLPTCNPPWGTTLWEGVTGESGKGTEAWEARLGDILLWGVLVPC